jgi:hypothetical protein
MQNSNGQQIAVRKQRGKRPRCRRSLAKIVAQIKPASYRRRNRELGGDHPVGKEVW